MESVMRTLAETALLW